MGAQVYLALFSLASCLGAGLLGFQGVQAARYRSERLNKTSAAIAGVLALAGIALFALRLGRPERLFSGFANLTSGITLSLYVVALFVVACVVMLVMSSRAEDGSVPAWCGWLAVAASVLLVAGTTCGWLLSAKLTGELAATAALMLGSACVLGAAAHLTLAAAWGDADAVGLGRRALLPCAVLAAVGMACYLGWYAADTQAAGAATKSALSMSTFTVGSVGATGVSAAERLSALLSGAGAPLFRGGAVACGVVVPLVCGACALVRRRVALPLAAVALLAAVAGAYALRACLQLL